jgi:archaetidylinositol phosphate synthase
MVLNKFRAKATNLINGPTNFFIRHNITPNSLSFFGFLFSLFCAILLGLNFLHQPLWLTWAPPLLLFISGCFDVFDGAVARKTNNTSQFGAFLDSNIDRLSDAIIYLGLIYGGYIDFFAGYICFFLSLMISYVRSRAQNEGVDMFGIGFLERAERMILIMCAMIVEAWVFFFTNATNSLFFFVFIWIFILLLTITFIQRIVFAYKELTKLELDTQE